MTPISDYDNDKTFDRFFKGAIVLGGFYVLAIIALICTVIYAIIALV